jgi:hypothetical protein
MSDNDLEAKFSGLAMAVLSNPQQRKLMDLCWKVESLAKAGAIAEAARVV